MRIKESSTKITLATFFVILGLAMMAAIQDENSLGFCLFDFVEQTLYLSQHVLKGIMCVL